MSRDPRVRFQADLFRDPQPPHEREPHAPHQLSSATSYEASRKISPVFAGNKKTCLNAIASAGNRGITRKQIAEAYFEGKQNYVTGPVAVLIEEHLVFEDPMRDRWGAIVQRPDGSPMPRRVDGSAVLLLTPKGRAVAA